jgi:hypothetical protein
MLLCLTNFNRFVIQGNTNADHRPQERAVLALSSFVEMVARKLSAPLPRISHQFK